MYFFDTSASRNALSGALRLEMWRDTLETAITSAMPDGTLEEEFTEALLFVLSIRLNRLTGGAPDMTFSARCHNSSKTARLLSTRMIWAAMGAGIDLYCASFRGEALHCETAWYNHTHRIA
ncbi:hypothetical protein [Puniceibacterium sp. IMCC21224]|uniref:hypothetical protein n=1 Tax=Puniceibacterium sp. IMCC21224 TaxID=1618204 RepID=UPI00064DD6B3|nr:hypothetical protein [Puniceibacterium sp. IMCC21224]KMK66651.1 hypothetical protein IMCC21224_111507 [Puniceibacterium sp. IMCC21224]